MAVNGRLCTCCHEFKDWAQFQKRSSRKNGYTEKCKPCLNTNKRSKYDYQKSLGYQLKRKYKLSLEQYLQMVEDQGGRCAICGEIPTQRLHVDHNHNCCRGEVTCGECIRGLLCNGCNKAIGLLKDNRKVLRSALEYLR